MRYAASAAIGLAVLAGMFLWWQRRPPDVPPDRLFQVALRALDEGDRTQVATIDAAFERFETDRRYWRHLAVLEAVYALRRNQPEEAVRELADEPLESPVREHCLRYLGEALYRIDRLADAQRVFEELQRDYPQNPDASKWLGAVYYDLGAYDAAITQLKQATDRQPKEHGPWHLLGAMYKDFEASEDAIDHLNEALKRNPPAAARQSILEDLVDELIDDRQYERALTLLQTADPSAAVQALEARARWNLGQAEAAAAVLDRSLEQDPASFDARRLKAEMLEHEGRADEAIQLLQEVLNEAPDRLEVRYQLAIALQQAGRDDEAKTQMELWKKQRALADELIELNLKAVSDSSDARVRDRLAEICEQLGRMELAEMWAKAADACRQREALRQHRRKPKTSDPART